MEKLQTSKLHFITSSTSMSLQCCLLAIPIILVIWTYSSALVFLVFTCPFLLLSLEIANKFHSIGQFANITTRMQRKNGQIKYLHTWAKWAGVSSFKVPLKHSRWPSRLWFQIYIKYLMIGRIFLWKLKILFQVTNKFLSFHARFG